MPVSPRAPHLGQTCASVSTRRFGGHQAPVSPCLEDRHSNVWPGQYNNRDCPAELLNVSALSVTSIFTSLSPKATAQFLWAST